MDLIHSSSRSSDKFLCCYRLLKYSRPCQEILGSGHHSIFVAASIHAAFTASGHIFRNKIFLAYKTFVLAVIKDSWLLQCREALFAVDTKMNLNFLSHKLFCRNYLCWHRSDVMTYWEDYCTCMQTQT
jgi:hypothetical protein